MGLIAARLISKEGIIGYVHSIFERSFLIYTYDKRLIFVVKKGLSNGPINIVIDIAGNQSFPLTLKLGDIVTRLDDSLFIGQSLGILLSGSEIWRSSKKLLKFDDPINLNEKINLVKRLAIDQGNHDGLGQLIKYELEIINGDNVPNKSLNMIAMKALPFLEELISGFLTNNIEMVEEAAEGLIGLGLGLTPSADDTLSGIMTGLYILGNSFPQYKNYILAVNKAIISKVDVTRTTLVSKEFLEHSARGEVAETVNSVITDILSPSENLLNFRVNTLLKMGETSGTDITLGIILGLRMGLELIKGDTFKEPLNVIS